ncbi:hypothetical protein BFP72_00795 [Reichenbachiella sp. 5M10]|uniref:hypothetical protein n=1 Tax=Reichenbachiella sp. 5M10 TaxID=1889772 RepID=UPI000C1601A2|nr:hypothetical protein [Reichenbachiella sp. 5M10]PIB34067.1 hypothetical protein BFP72_00795 [Reichenbachiella sp. 5M10]
MEELDIKQIWKKGNETEEAGYSVEAIESIIRQRPQNIISRFVKNLRIEKWLNLVVLTAVCIYLGYTQMWVMAAIMLTFNLLFFFYYRALIRELDQKIIDQDVVRYLNEVHKSICRFFKHFKITLVVVGMAAFAFGFYIGYTQNDKYTSVFVEDNWWKWAWGAVVIVSSMVFAYFMFQHMYGKKGRQIKEMVESLNRDEVEG